MTAPDPAIEGLDVYVVGGAVRDALLGLPAGDRDWVVVGTTPEAMARRGFTPVGGDFPVFLHPRTREEYALARTERKSGRGYRGFTFHTGPEVTLEEDLGRRDLTVNAIAQAADGRLVDPHDGQADVRARVLRHVGPAFVEDPVRILRLARFAARFDAFSVAPDTLALCRRMVADGEVDALVPERVWREVSRGLMQAHPSRMLDVLAQTGALARIAPGLDADAATLRRIDEAARAGLPLPGRYALLVWTADAPAELGRRLKAPNDCADQARLLHLLCDGDAAAPADADAALRVLEQCDALRKPDRFAALLDSAAVLGPIDRHAWQAWLAAVRGVDAGAIAQRVPPTHIRDAVRAARLDALAAAGLPGAAQPR